jgi:hypothetical protein
MLIDYRWTSKSKPLTWFGQTIGFSDDGLICDAQCDLVRVEYGGECIIAQGLGLQFENIRAHGDGILRLTMDDVPMGFREALHSALVACAYMPEMPSGLVLGRSGDYPGMTLTGIVLAAEVGPAGPGMIRVGPIQQADVEAFLTAQRAERNAVT